MRTRLAVCAALLLALAAALYLRPGRQLTKPAGSGAPAPPVATKVNPADGLTYVRIPPGTFLMGCSPRDNTCEDDETPAHTVTITKGFWMGQTEVTQGAYQRVMSANPSRLHGDRLPVEQVSWDEANAYCRAVGMRLPTEAEWEYAARAGSTASRYGDPDAIAWHGGNSEGRTHEVGQKQPNAWKLYDMLGNVSEWTNDWYDANYYGPREFWIRFVPWRLRDLLNVPKGGVSDQAPTEDPGGPPSGEYRVVRWGGDRVSSRGRLQADYWGKFSSVGFRCAGEVVREEVPTLITAGNRQRDEGRYNEAIASFQRAPAPPVATKVNPADGLTYVWIPAGSFQMGCSPRDSECESDEKPAHTLTITKGFWMGQTEVTQAAYQRVMGKNRSHSRGARLPMETVRWDEANAYCRAVGIKLPTEAQWEYAARAGSTVARYGQLDAIAWYDKNSGNQTHEVAQKQPNAWKLYDMLGNVYEWTNDRYSSNYYSQSPSQDPQGPSSGEYRVLRGGGYGSDVRGARASRRVWAPPYDPGYMEGFRCAGR